MILERVPKYSDFHTTASLSESSNSKCVTDLQKELLSSIQPMPGLTIDEDISSDSATASILKSLNVGANTAKPCVALDDVKTKSLGFQTAKTLLAIGTMQALLCTQGVPVYDNATESTCKPLIQDTRQEQVAATSVPDHRALIEKMARPPEVVDAALLLWLDTENTSTDS